MTLAASVYTFSAGRIGASTAALVALAGLVIGVLALVRKRNERKGSVIALITGAFGIALGGLVVVTAGGGLGTGNGLGGGFVAIIFGVAGIVVGWLARRRA